MSTESVTPHVLPLYEARKPGEYQSGISKLHELGGGLKPLIETPSVEQLHQSLLQHLASHHCEESRNSEIKMSTTNSQPAEVEFKDVMSSTQTLLQSKLIDTPNSNRRRLCRTTPYDRIVRCTNLSSNKIQSTNISQPQKEDGTRNQTGSSSQKSEVGTGHTGSTPASLPKSEEEILKKHRFSHIGNYLLYDLVPGSVDATLYATQVSKPDHLYICKVVPIHSFTNAIRATLRLDGESEHICAVHEVCRGPDYVYMFYDTPAEDLHAYMRHRRRLREQDARPLFRQIVHAVSDCHRQGVIIRDVKLRKFVFTDQQRSVLKLESLDGAYVLDNPADDTVGERVGCLAYVSPEVLTSRGYSGRRADVWSLGVVLYAMLVGRYPFYDGHQAGMLSRIKAGAVALPEALSYAARSLLRALLQYEPSKRLSADEILRHPWFTACDEAGCPRAGAGCSGSSRDQRVPHDNLYDRS